MSEENKHGRSGGGSLLSPGYAGDRRRSDDLQEAIDLLADRHRRARSRREASENPFLTALSGNATPDDASHRLAEARLRRESANHPVSSSLLSREPEHPVAAEPVSTPRRKPARQESVRAQDAPDAGQAEHEEELLQAEDTHEHPPVRYRVASGGEEIWKPLVDPMAVVHGVMNSKKIIAATTVAGALLGVFLALNTPKTYVSTAEILIDPRDIKIADRELTSGGLPSDATLAIVENQVRVMYSGPVLQKVVADLKLASDPEFNGTGKGGLGSLIGSVRSLISRGDGPADASRKSALAIENLARALTIERGGKTFIVTVSAKTRDPDKSALIANKVFTVFMDEAGKIQSRTASRAESELGSRLGELRAGVQNAEQAVEDYKSANDLVDAQGRLISDDEIVKINDQLSVARAGTIELNAKVRSVRALDADSVSGGALPESVNSAVLSELRSQNARLRQEADSLANSLGPRHPKRQAVEAQIEGARRQIAAELQRIASSIQIELKRAIEQEQALAARLAEAKARQANVSDKLVHLRELEREAAAQRAIYENYLLRARDAGEQKSVNTANISLISEAQPPLLPSGVSRSMIVIALTVLGFVAGIGLGALRGAIASFRGERRAMPEPAPFLAGPVDERPRRSASKKSGRTHRPSPRGDEALSESAGGHEVNTHEPAASPVSSGKTASPLPPPAHANTAFAPSAPAPMQPGLWPTAMMTPAGFTPAGYVPQAWPPVMQPQPIWPSWPMQPPMPVMMQPSPVMMPVAPQPAAPAAETARQDHSDELASKEANERELAQLRDSLRAVREKVRGLNERRARRNY